VPPTRHAGPERAGLVAVAVVAALIGIALVALGPDRSASSDAVVAAARAPEPAVAPATTAPSKASATRPANTTATAPAGEPTPTTVDPGTLPQTDEHPTASGTQFDAGVQGLWRAITSDDPASALPFFFPQSAYVQVKAISDPVGDYHSRLIANFGQDIHTLHAQLGADASRATLTGLTVPGDQAVWVQPGAEYNKGSYWRVYGSTLHYTVDGQDHSFPVSSLISWRGQWYVVHLGEIR
jgi:hypothetical protein